MSKEVDTILFEDRKRYGYIAAAALRYDEGVVLLHLKQVFGVSEEQAKADIDFAKKHIIYYPGKKLTFCKGSV